MKDGMTQQTSELQASALQASELQASELQASELQASELQASALQASALQASEPQASEPQASEPQASELQASELQASELQASELQASLSQTLMASSTPIVKPVRLYMGVMDEEVRPVLAKEFKRHQEKIQRRIEQAEADYVASTSSRSSEEASAEPSPGFPTSTSVGRVSEDSSSVGSSPYVDLDDGGAVMVLFRMKPSDDPTKLLEGNLADITNDQHNQWSFLSHGTSNGLELRNPWQKLVDGMSASLEKGRTPVGVLRQGSAKVKAGDDMLWRVGLLSRGGPITHISTIVHQTFNMGLNGSLMVNEANCVLQALVENHILASDPFNPSSSVMRSLDVISYGAGGAARHGVKPGDLAVSDGVIDLRTHVDPRCIIKFLDEQLLSVCVTDRNRKRFLDYFQICEEIAKQMESPNSVEISGFALIEHVTSLMQIAAALTHKSQKELIIPDDQKVYYGEITFGTIERGVRTVSRSTFDAVNHGSEWRGTVGQKAAINWAVHRMQDMGHLATGELDERTANEDVTQAHQRLQQEIRTAQHAFDERRRENHEVETDFTITASANLFFTEDVKRAVAAYGTKTVEMENQILLHTLNTILRRPESGIHLHKAFITKMAADPHKIDQLTIDALNEWTETATMSLDDYMDAYTWTSRGSFFAEVPKSADWVVIHKLHPEIVEREFVRYPVANDRPNVMNPFWKEIGTDLLNEIREQDPLKDAFSGTIWTEWKKDKANMQIIEQLKNRAATLLQSNPIDRQEVKNLFRSYLALTPMSSKNGQRLPAGRYQVYARTGVCKEGVAAPLRDYDPLLYKANNTAMLALNVSTIMPREDGPVRPRRKAGKVGKLDRTILDSMRAAKEESAILNPTIAEERLEAFKCRQILFQQLNKLRTQIGVMGDKAKELAKNNHISAALAAQMLCADLDNLVRGVSKRGSLLDEHEIEYFKNDCRTLIQKARPELEKHRGWSQLLGNLVLAIGLLGVGYLAAGLVNLAVTRKFLFFSTDSAAKLHQLDRAVDEFAPSAMRTTG